MRADESGFATATFDIETLGVPSFPSPLRLAPRFGEGFPSFVTDDVRVRFNIEVSAKDPECRGPLFEKAGPRERIFFDPRETKAAIVTCGGLCPGLNNVIRSIFLELFFNYGVKEIWGIRYGYAGLNPENGFEPQLLTEEWVESILNDGGTKLGSSRGHQNAGIIVDFLVSRGMNVVFCIGGDGTQRGAWVIAQEAKRRRLKIAVVGIPKTIDNDIPYVSPSFGYNTAIARARDILESAHAEAKGAPYGIGLVKLMGREAGFIAAGATLASQQVNFCLVPEVPLVLDGERGFLNVLRQRMLARQHAVIAVAEGAGQDLFGTATREYDASGNIKLHDIGGYLRERILSYFDSLGLKVNLKYFEPSYYIRSVPANTVDMLLCDQYARHAVHAAMAGKTAVVIGYWNDKFIHVPMSAIVSHKRRLDLGSELWRAVLAVTGQPAAFS